MGFVPNRKVYKLRFVDEEMAGLVVRAESVPLGVFLDVAEWIDVNPRSVDPEDIRKVTSLFTTFAEALVDWNVEKPDGAPVPANLDGLRAQDADFALAIIFAWYEAIGSVSTPLGATSSAGGPSPAPPIPMEPLSRSRAS